MCFFPAQPSQTAARDAEFRQNPVEPKELNQAIQKSVISVPTAPAKNFASDALLKHFDHCRLPGFQPATRTLLVASEPGRTSAMRKILRGHA